jgi:hypothetical protein
MARGPGEKKNVKYAESRKRAGGTLALNPAVAAAVTSKSLGPALLHLCSQQVSWNYSQFVAAETRSTTRCWGVDLFLVASITHSTVPLTPPRCSPLFTPLVSKGETGELDTENRVSDLVVLNLTGRDEEDFLASVCGTLASRRSAGDSSVSLLRGPKDVRKWNDSHGHKTVAQLRKKVSLASVVAGACTLVRPAQQSVFTSDSSAAASPAKRGGKGASRGRGGNR